MADAFIGEIRAVGFGWIPDGWLPCDGSLLPVSQYQALYAVIGNSFGGNQSSFAVPDLRGRVVNSQGIEPSGEARSYAESYGAESVSLAPAQAVLNHTHNLVAATAKSGLVDSPANNYLGHSLAAGAVSYAPASSGAPPAAMNATAIGASGAATVSAHENRQPFQVMNYVICVEGTYPVRQ